MVASSVRSAEVSATSLPTSTNSACGYPPRYALRLGLPRTPGHSVAIPELCNQKRVTIDLVNHAVFVCGAPGPVSRQGMLERFWLSNACTSHMQSMVLARLARAEEQEMASMWRSPFGAKHQGTTFGEAPKP